EMYDMFHIWDFNNPALCRARLYCSTFSTISSAMILLAVAVTRYRKVCHPHKWQITIRTAKVISIVLATVGVLVSIPYAILNGRQTKPTPRSDIHAYECTTDDEYVNTSYPLANYAFFLVMYISCSVSLTVLYILIGAKAWKHSKIHGASPSTPMPALENATSSKYTSKVTESSSQHSCTSCGSPNSKSVDTSIAVESAIRITSCAGDINIKQFHVGGDTIESPIQYSIRVFTDRIEVQTTMVGEFFAKLQQTKPGLLKLPSYVDSRDNSICSVTNLQVEDCLGEKTSALGIKRIDSDDSNDGIYDIDSNGRLTESCPDDFLYQEDKLVADRIDDKINEPLNTFRSKQCFGNNGQEYNNHILNLRNEVDQDKQYPASADTDTDEVSDESDPLSVFKWLDVIYSPDEGHSTLCPCCVQRDASLSFRLSLNNNLLQKTEWLRTRVLDALGGHDKSTKGKSFFSVLEQNPAVTNTHTSSCGPVACHNKSLTESVRPQHNTNLARNRLREIVTQKLSSLKIGSQRQKIRRRPIGRTTIMLIIISVIYILGYLPHLTLMLAKFLSPSMLVNMSMVDLTFYNLFLRTYFLNCAANPIVYSLCDSNFRRACFKVIKCS
ncbi:unnamed protein product, partial [Candidula unifasciata]